MQNSKLTKIAAIGIGVIIAILLIVMAVGLFQQVFTRASDIEPRDVVIADITENTAKATWSTGIETQGVIEYGTSPTALNFFAPESNKTKAHSVDLTLLSPSTTYYFQIRIGDKKYDNGGVPWTFTTRGKEQPAVPTAKPTAAAVLPSPVQTITLPSPTPEPVCNETDCTKIKTKLGQGCSTADYFKCVRKLTPTASASPSATPTP